ncbi:MAG: GNAT family N-acetyltransferase [Candidatus Dormibacteraeota bacterium]|nr:GNAT family N-acetyltransferase [Candidatus Dormibacteraeota bacterium]
MADEQPEIRIEEMAGDDPAVTAMLVDLTLDEQDHYEHPRETRAEVERRMRISPTFTGHNRLLVARDREGAALGVCWVVLFDPGTGLEGEIAELYVKAGARGGGVARRLVTEAAALLRAAHVSFASVWTRDDNPAALAAYRAAGFAPTEQAVLTWLPSPMEHQPPGDGDAGAVVGRE